MDEELSGAAAALLGLHARNSDKPAPPPVAPPPRPIPVSLPGGREQSQSRYQPWSRSQISASPSYEPEAEDGNGRQRTQVAIPEDSPLSNPYPFYPTLALAKPTAAAVVVGPPYPEQQQQQQRPKSDHAGVCFDPSSTTVVSTRHDFLAASGGRAGWIQQQQQQQQPIISNAAANPPPPPPRRRAEWTPRFGPPAAAADPRAILDARHAAAFEWTYLQQQQQPQRSGISPTARTSPPSPSHHVGPGARDHFPGFRQNVTAGAAPHHVIRDHFRGDSSALTVGAPGSAGSGPPAGRFSPPREYEQQQQQQQQLGQHVYQQHDYQREQRAAGTAIGQHERRQPAPQQQPQQQQQQQQQRTERPSINNLWSLIPGTLEREGTRPGSGNTVVAGDLSGSHSQQQQPGGGKSGAGYNADRWFAPDVHPPLSDIARRHRARALARLRARKRALAEAAQAQAQAQAAATTASLGPERPTPVKRLSSESTTNEADSGSDDDDEEDGRRRKVFLADGGGGVARVVSGGVTRGVSGGVARAVSGGSVAGDDGVADGEAASDRGAASEVVVVDGPGRDREENGVSREVAAGGEVTAASANASVHGNTAAAGDPSSVASRSNDVADPSRSNAGSGSSSSKVGDLFQLMRNVTMSFGAGATGVGGVGGSGSGGVGGGTDPADGEENLARELGKPVKYRYRQEAARSRKRTRGRFVSEKAPAFVSITELMALRRAERERQQKDEAAPVPVGAR